LADVVTKQKFQDHEFIDVAHQTATESASAFASADITAIEAAHQVAFRTGLGNSIFAKPTARINNAAVKAYAHELFTSGNVAFVGTGIDHEILQNLAETYLGSLPSGKLALAGSKYYGGESRIDTVSNKGEYVLAFEGAAADSTEFAALQVLRQALGGEVTVQHTTGSGILAQTAAKFAHGTEIRAFNLGYSDAGLFGVQVSAATAETGAAISAAAEQLKAVAKGLSNEDFSRAVAQAKYAATSGFESRLDRLETLGVQALRSGKYTSAAESVAAIGKVTTADVAQVS
jgi:ubiquinol-cytochrome c reductase core subunit 2